MFELFGMQGPYVLILALVAAGLVFGAIRFFLRSTPVSTVHPARKPVRDHHGHACKFDEAEVRRTAHLARQLKDFRGLAPADPKIAALLASVDEKEVTRMLMELTGEVETGGVKIVTRSSHHKDLQLAVNWVVGFYKALGFGDQARLPGSTLTVHTYKKSGRTLQNVIAELPGTVSNNKVLIVGSHIDSTAGTPWRSENAAPGADDDGSGTVGVMQLAKALSGQRPSYRIRFCHFSGEEQGLWGSTVYSDVVANERLEVIGMLQMDMIGYCRAGSKRVDIHDNVDQNGSHVLTVALARAASQYGLKLDVVDTHNRAVEGRSDHAPFLDHGMKAVLISEEFSDEGFNPHYHSLKDRVANCNLPWMTEVIRMVLAGSIELAQVQVK